jgi:hypothetical protein
VNLYVEPVEGLENLISHGGTLVRGKLQAKPGPFTKSWFRADRRGGSASYFKSVTRWRMKR